MTLERTTVWLGFVALLAGVVRMLMTPASLIWGLNSVPELVAGYTGCVLMAVGSVGLMLGQSQKAGIPGFIGAMLMSVGNVLTSTLVGIALMNTGTEPPQALSLTATVTMFLGFIIFGLVSVWANVYPRWASVLLIAAPIITTPLVLSDYFALLWGLTYVAFGYRIWKPRRPASHKVIRSDLHETNRP